MPKRYRKKRSTLHRVSLFKPKRFTKRVHYLNPPGKVNKRRHRRR